MPRKQSEPFEVGAVEVLKNTGKALLVKSAEHGEVWIPLSQVHDDSEVFDDTPDGEVGNLVVTEWLATERGWT